MTGPARPRWAERPWPVHPFVLVLVPFVATWAENTDSVTLGDTVRSALPAAIAVAIAVIAAGAALGLRRGALVVSAVLAAVTIHVSDLQPWLLLGFLLAGVGVLFARGDLAVPTTFVNLVAVGFWGMPVYGALTAPGPGPTAPRPGYLEAFDDQVPKPTGPLPDVWWILLDGHGRQDVLAEKYGVTDDFAGWLRSRGFFVADGAHSNYAQTAFSVASTLNFEPVETLLDDIDPRSRDRLPLGKLARNNRVVHLFRERGYRIASYRSEYGLTEIDRADEVRGPLGIWRELDGIVLSATSIPWVSRRLTGEYWPLQHAMRRIALDRTLDDLAEGDRDDGPTLVLAHIVAPHPPFVFDRDGRPTHSPGRSMADGSHWKSTHRGEDYVEGYAGQVHWLDGRIRTVIDGILAADPDAVILLHGDHGPGSDLDWASLEKTDLDERLSILWALRIPGGEDRLVPWITPVNGFRVVLSEVFGAELPLLPDRSTWQSWSRPFVPIDVTGRLRGLPPGPP